MTKLLPNKNLLNYRRSKPTDWKPVSTGELLRRESAEAFRALRTWKGRSKAEWSQTDVVRGAMQHHPIVSMLCVVGGSVVGVVALRRFIQRDRCGCSEGRSGSMLATAGYKAFRTGTTLLKSALLSNVLNHLEMEAESLE